LEEVMTDNGSHRRGLGHRRDQLTEAAFGPAGRSRVDPAAGCEICTGSTRLQGANMVTDPSKDMVTGPAGPGACLPVNLVVNQYVETEVRLPAFARIYQAA
jgi:hypothetical protein